MNDRYFITGVLLALAAAVTVYGFSLVNISRTPQDEEQTVTDEYQNSFPDHSKQYSEQEGDRSAQPDTGIADSRISSVTSDAQRIGLSNFPDGFFSDNDSEHGLINYADAPVVVTIKFKESAKLKTISNIFTHCTASPLCYTWSATGTTPSGSSIDLVTGVATNSDIESKAEIVSIEGLNEIKITATRTGGTDRYVHWKKITLGYK
ncbi:MAG: hypothetical protein A2991_00925 [Candidatus Terrybacteria bacterium RIFCSPLOWO2_01_FULL_58_14]|uniref:Uncharacterized protein n=1 Tax=Candidatus Terrybacteria bacterium RIFCSPLOWO2_01_FULL_58_14 TaxID=1802369 RepID=A0A1G2PXM2_9BACT|nr:MAG: hypothetical protein A2991_00925 [Candidatus Terrybacteria bacterium RIFCSPLOWO2_01_FULL_58_14]